jgi:hypothetical protein
MDYLTPFRGMIGGDVRRRPLTEHDLARARALGSEVISHWRRGDRDSMRRTALDFALGGAAPLLGCLIFGWQATLVGVAIAIDIMIVWICDVIKLALAREQVEYQIDWREKFDQVVHIARALVSNPERFPEPGRAERRALLYAEFIPRYNAIAPLLLIAGFIVSITGAGLTALFVLFSVVRPANAMLDVGTCALLFLSFLPRVALTIRDALRSRDAPGSHARMSLQAFLPASTLILSLLLFLMSPVPFTLLPQYGGLLFIAFYAAVALAVFAIARAYMLRNVRTVETLLAADEQAQRMHLRRYVLSAIP